MLTGVFTAIVTPFKKDESIDFDAQDYWFRCRFSAQEHDAVLDFEGLATLADVWLNGEPILSSVNMYLRHQVEP